MSAPKLVIRKRMLPIQGKVRPCCSVQAVVDPAVRAVLEKHFLGETLFRRAAYSQSWPEGTLKIPPALGPAMSSFLKNDACPEISVKSMLAGQMHQGANVWEMLSFEVIAKVAFDNLMLLVATVADLERDVAFEGTLPPPDLSAFEADTAAEILTLDATAFAA